MTDKTKLCSCWLGEPTEPYCAKHGEACAECGMLTAKHTKGEQGYCDEVIALRARVESAERNADYERDCRNKLRETLRNLMIDTERLDWLEENDYPCFERWSSGWGLAVHDKPSLRDAIDAEMEGRR